MAYYFLFSEKDTTIYSHPDRTDMNTGGDEILEIVEEKATTGNSYYASRVLIQFKTTELKDVLENRLKDGNGDRVSEGNWSTNLQLFTTENNKNLSTDHIVEVYPISQSWNEGTQRYDANPPTTTTGSFQAANGATWIYRTESTSSAWITSSFGTGATGSYTIQEGGGNWYTGSEFKSSQDFFAGGDDFDLNLDVTNIVKKFSASYYQSATHPTGLPNRGFIIKKPTDTEEDDFGSGYLQYFSTNTHTIYPPKLTFRWDDSTYSPSYGATTLSSGDIFLTLHNNKATFQRKSKQRFRLTTRKRYPDRTFTTSSNYLDTQYLPAASYYSLRDAETDEVIIPFDTDYTKLSADSEGMYFDLFMEGLQPERYYKLMFRSDNNDGVQIFDEDYFFKVIR